MATERTGLTLKEKALSAFSAFSAFSEVFEGVTFAAVLARARGDMLFCFCIKEDIEV